MLSSKNCIKTKNCNLKKLIEKNSFILNEMNKLKKNSINMVNFQQKDKFSIKYVNFEQNC